MNIKRNYSKPWHAVTAAARRDLILRTLPHYDGFSREMARYLGISVSSLYREASNLGIAPPKNVKHAKSE